MRFRSHELSATHECSVMFMGPLALGFVVGASISFSQCSCLKYGVCLLYIFLKKNVKVQPSTNLAGQNVHFSIHSNCS